MATIRSILNNALSQSLYSAFGKEYAMALPKDGLLLYVEGGVDSIGESSAILEWSASGPVCDGNGGLTTDLPVQDKGVWVGPGYTNELPSEATYGGQAIVVTTDGVAKITSIGAGSNYLSLSFTHTSGTPQSRRILARSVTGVGSVGMLTWSGDANRQLVDLTEEWTEITFISPDLSASAAELLFYLVDFRTFGTTLSEVLVKEPQVVDGIGHYPYILPGTTSASMAGSSGGNGLFIEMAGERADGVELFTNPTLNPWMVDNGDNTYTSQSDGIGDVQQLNGCSVGDEVVMSFRVAGYTSGSVGVSSSFCAGGVYVTSDGSYSFNCVALTTDPRLIATVEGVTLSEISFQVLENYEDTPLLECYRGAPDGVEIFNDDLIDLDGSLATRVSDLVYDIPYLTTVGSSEVLHPGPFSLGKYVLFAYTILENTTTNEGLYLSSQGYPEGTVVLDATVGSHVNVTRSSGSSLFRLVNRDTAGGYVRIRLDSLQLLTPQPMTVVVGVTMGVSSTDIATEGDINILAIANLKHIKCIKAVGIDSQIARANEGSTSTTLGTYLPWDALEVHYKIIQVSEDGLQFRVGNLRKDIDTVIQWSGWVTYDGSFDPLDYLRFALDNTIPMWFKGFAQYNTALSEIDILKVIKEMR